MLQIKNTLGSSKSEGLYVWKKYSHISITLKMTRPNPIYLSISFSDGRTVTSLDDIKNIKFTFLESINDYCIINDNDEWEYYTGGTTPSASWNCYMASDNLFYIDASIVDCAACAEGLSGNAEKNFIDYVVSDNETKYPDRAVQDGYYYEKFVDVLDSMGFTKYAVDEYVPTSNQSPTQYFDTRYGHTFNHSLGETPKFAILLCPYLLSSGTYGSTQFLVSAFMAIKDPNSTYWSGFSVWVYTGTRSNNILGSNNNDAWDTAFTDTTITLDLYNGSEIKLASGRPYYIITVA